MAKFRHAIIAVGVIAAGAGVLAAIATRRRALPVPNGHDAAIRDSAGTRYTSSAPFAVGQAQTAQASPLQERTAQASSLQIATIEAQARLRLIVAAIAAVVALILISLGALTFLYDSGGADGVEDALARGAWLCLSGGAALGMALWLAQRPPLPRPTIQPMTSGRVRLRWLLPGMGMLALLAILNGGVFGERLFDNVSYHLQMALFVLGIVGVTLGLGGVRRLAWRVGTTPASSAGQNDASSENGQAENRQARYSVSLPMAGWWRREWAGVAALTLLALIVRAWGVDSLLHDWRDETLFVEAIFELWNNPTIDTLVPVPGISAILAPFPYMQSITVALFGADLAGMRALTALLGALTIPAVYLLARALFNRKTALIAALILATFPPHIHFSRLALYNIADPLFGTWALAFFALALRHNRRLDWALAGALLALTHYFYEGGRLLFTPLLGVWLIGMIFITPGEDGKRWRKHLPWNGLVTFGVAFFVVIAPLYYTWIVQQRPFSPRYDQTRGTIPFVNYLPDYWHTLSDDFTLDDLPRRLDNLAGRIPTDFHHYYMDHVRPPLLHFLRDTDGSGFYYGGQTPLLLVYTLPFFLFGALLLLWRLRAPGSLLLLLWLLLTILGNSLIWQNNWSPRFVAGFPAAVVVIAVGIVGTLSLLIPPPVGDGQVGQIVSRRRARVAAGVALLLAALQVGYYFGAHLPHYNRQIRMDRKDYIDAAYRARDFPPGTQMFLVTDDEPYFHHYIVLEQLWGVDLNWTEVPSEEARQAIVTFLLDHVDDPRDVAVFIKPEDLSMHHWLRENFGIERPQFSPYDVPQFAQYALYYIDVTP